MSENVVKLENNFNQAIERKIAVIFVTDVVGFSKLMEINEDETLKSFRACRDLLDKLFAEHGGRVFNTAGDSVLAEFQSAVSAVVCANEFQKLLKERNNSVSDDAKMSFRIGLNMGDVIVEGENLIRSLKLAADDLRHYYYQAAMAKPGIKSDVELGDWFYGETLAGWLFIKIRDIMLNSDDKDMKVAGRTNYVPNAMLKHVLQ